MNFRRHSLQILFQLMIMTHGLITAVMSNRFPRILTSSYNQTLNISETAILTCQVNNLGHHHVTWLRYDPKTLTYIPLTVDEQVFDPDRRYFVSSYSTSTDESHWNLEISNLKSSDEGFYECKISNRRASVSMKIFLQIQVPMTLEPSRLAVEPGASVALDCTIYNINTSSIVWHFSTHNQTFHSNQYHHDIREKYHYENNLSKSQLIIRHAQPYHTGLWTCIYKRQRRSAKLFVEKGALQRHHHHRHHEQQRLLSSDHSPSSASSSSSSFIQCTMSLILFALLLGHHMTRRI